MVFTVLAGYNVDFRKPANFADAVILAEIIYDFKGIFLIPSFRAFSINPGRLNCLGQLIPDSACIGLINFYFQNRENYDEGKHV